MHNVAALNRVGMEYNGMLLPGCRGKLQTQVPLKSNCILEIPVYHKS